MSPGWLAAIGRASPAIQEVGQGMEAWAKDIREGPMREETQRLGLEEKRTGLALSKEALEQDRIKTQEMKTEQEWKNAPEDLNGYLDKMKITEDVRPGILAFSERFGVKGGRGRREDVVKAMNEFLKDPQGKAIIEGQANIHHQAHVNAVKKLQEAVQKGDVDRIGDLQKKVDETKSNDAMWGGISQAQSQMLTNRESLTEEINKYKNTEEWNKLPFTLQSSLERSADMGDEPGFRKTLDEYTKLLKPSGTGTPQKFTKPDGTIGWVTPGAEIPEGWEPWQAGGKGGDLDKKRNFFEVEYPQWKGKLGTPQYAAAFEKWRAQEASKITVSVAGAEARGEAWEKTRGKDVFDTKTGDIIPVNQAEINRAMKEEPGRYLSGAAAERAKKQWTYMNEMGASINDLRNSVNKMPPISNANLLEMGKVLAVHKHGMIDTFITTKFYNRLSTEQQDFIIKLMQTKESAMGMRQVLGAGQGSDLVREAIDRTLPGIIVGDKRIMLKQLESFDIFINRMKEGLVNRRAFEKMGTIGGYKGEGGKTEVRRGKEKGTGKTVIEYSDGSRDYATD